MALPNDICARLVLEWLVNIDDLDDFKEDKLNQSFKKIHTSTPGIPGVAATGGAAAVTAVAPVPSVIVSEKCDLRLKVASIAYHYYVFSVLDVTAANRNYTNVLKLFNVEYEYLITLSKDTKPDVSLLYKNQTPIKWIESFKCCLLRTYGLFHCPLLCIVWEDGDVSNESDVPIVSGYSYGASVFSLDEFISRLYHTDFLYKYDNSMVY